MTLLQIVEELRAVSHDISELESKVEVYQDTGKAIPHLLVLDALAMIRKKQEAALKGEAL